MNGERNDIKSLRNRSTSNTNNSSRRGEALRYTRRRLWWWWRWWGWGNGRLGLFRSSPGHFGLDQSPREDSLLDSLVCVCLCVGMMKPYLSSLCLLFQPNHFSLPHQKRGTHNKNISGKWFLSSKLKIKVKQGVVLGVPQCFQHSHPLNIQKTRKHQELLKI